MEWIDWVHFRPGSKNEIIEKLDHDGYTFPHYSRRINGTVLLVDELQLSRDCSFVGTDLSEVYPRQVTLF